MELEPDALKEESEKVAEHTCSNCGRTSPLTEHYVNFDEGILCPLCLQRQELEAAHQTSKTIFVSVIFSGLLAVGLFLYGTGNHYIWANLFLLLPLWYLTLGVYVAVQAIAALLLGGKVYKLQIGDKPFALEKKLNKCKYIAGLFPFGSMFCMGLQVQTRLKQRLIAIYASGIVVHAIIVLIFISQYHNDRLTTGYAIREILTITNIYMLYTIAIPSYLMMSGTRFKNNATIIGELVSGEFDSKLMHQAYYMFECADAIEEKDYVQADRICLDGLKTFPESTHLMSHRTVALHKSGQSDKAIELIDKVLSNPELPIAEKAMALNNKSWYLLGEGSDYEMALECAQGAFQVFPWSPHIEGTYGAALVENDDPKAGLPHILEATKNHESQESKAISFAYASIASSRLHDPTNAALYLASAIELDRNAEYVEQAVVRCQT